MRHLSTVAVCSLVTALVLTWQPSQALACGISSVDGAWSCSLAEHEESERLKWHLGGSALYTTTRLRFSKGVEGDEQRSAALATLTYAPTARLTLQGSAGATLDGQLTLSTGRYDLSPGPLVAVGGAYRLLQGTPFLIATTTLAFSAVTTRLRATGHDVGYQAFDLRFGVLFGATVWDVLSPYALARVFGGPVLWRYRGEAVLGTDVHHFQLGAGLQLLLADVVNLYVEGSGLGEQAVAAGAALAF